MRRKLRWPTNANLRQKTRHTTPTSHCLSRGVAAQYVLKRGRVVGAGVGVPGIRFGRTLAFVGHRRKRFVH